VPHDVSLMRLAAWRAARSGVRGELLDPLTMRPRPAAEVVGALLDHVDEALVEAGDAERARETAESVLREGNGAVVQRRLLEEKGSLGAVVAECARRTQG
jgi:carboxylate-amine ligase